jgi:hypothetical protein
MFDVTTVSSHKSHGLITILEKDEGQFWITVNIEIAFISQSLYHFAFMTYVQFSLTVMLYLSDTFFFCSSHPLTFHHIVSISQEYSGVKVYSVFQFLNNVVGDRFNIYFCVFGVAIKILFIANDCAQFFDVAIAFTVNVP